MSDVFTVWTKSCDNGNPEPSDFLNVVHITKNLFLIVFRCFSLSGCSVWLSRVLSVCRFSFAIGFSNLFGQPKLHTMRCMHIMSLLRSSEVVHRF